MKRMWTFLALACLAVLGACGGGGGGSSTPSSASCDSTTLWASPTNASAIQIPENTTGLSVSWDNQNCSLQSVSSAVLEICLSHAQPSDLVWKITTPSSGTALTFTAPSNWNTTGTSCNFGQGKLQQINISSTVQSTVTVRGLWVLNVSDQSSNGITGTLDQWRLTLTGLR